MRTPRIAALLLTLAAPALLALVGLPALTAPAEAKRGGIPGSFTGYGFDTCEAPSQRAMDAWRRSSSYWAVGIYIGGMNRACDRQRHLDARWVRRQVARGWHLLPIVVGRQASCSPKGYYVGRRIGSNPDNDYVKARRQGRAAAQAGVSSARRYGIGKGSVLWFDLEHFDIGRKRCRESALAFTSAWTSRLHKLGYRSGFYSSASSGITMLDRARRAGRVEGRGRRRLPDMVWIAEWNGRATVESAYVGKQGWWPHRRVHQYRGGHDERHGGARINIDSNYLSVGRGSVAPKPAPHCGVRVSFRDYGAQRRGDRGSRVRAAQCLLRQKGLYHRRLHGRFDRRTEQAVSKFQRRHARVPDNGRMSRRTWTAMLAGGPKPLLKYGSASNAVRRLQRALNASGAGALPATGFFGSQTRSAVRAYQRARGLSRTGVVTWRVWRPLQRGMPAPERRRRTTSRDLVVSRSLCDSCD